MFLSHGFKLLRTPLLLVSLTMALPATSLAQGWGRQSKSDKWDRKWDKKCEKFVNCHDARDGRRDGRGPNGERFNDRFDRFDDRFNNRRFRNRDFDEDDIRRLQRRRMRNFRYGNRDYRYYNQNNNPYATQPGSNWTNLLNLFLQ